MEDAFICVLHYLPDLVIMANGGSPRRKLKLPDLTDSEEYTLLELTSFSSSPFNPTSSAEPQVVMLLPLKQRGGGGMIMLCTF